MKSVTCKMDSAIKALWVADLRSGKFPQAKGMLWDENANDGLGGYCCLGRLLAVQGDSPAEWDCHEELATSNLDENYAAGLTMDQTAKLSAMNDGAYFKGYAFSRRTFKQIAAYIERYL